VPSSIESDWREVLSAMTALSPVERPTAAELVELMRRLVIAETGHRPVQPPAELEAPDGAFDRITRLAARVLDVPIAIIRLSDGDRVWFTPWLADNTRLEARELTDQHGATANGLGFFAEAPIVTRDAITRGSLCVLDFDRRSLSNDERRTLDDLAAMLVAELEPRVRASNRARENA
jgi:hypothetical protein